MKKILLALLTSLALGLTRDGAAAEPLGTAFSYQGYLTKDGAPVKGEVQIQFSLYDGTNETANLLGQSVQKINVEQGLFTIPIDFGATIAGNEGRWLELLLIHPGGTNEILTPRQALTVVPNAIFATRADGLRPGAFLPSNSVPTSAIDASGAPKGGVLMFDGSSPVWSSPSSGSTGFWNLRGNSGTLTGPNFLGTLDNVPLQVKVNNALALRLEPGVVPNIIAGHGDNFVAGGVVGATIGGGGGHFDFDANLSHEVGESYGTIAGGEANYVGGKWSAIGGGRSNAATGTNAVVAGGGQNSAPGHYSTVSGGGYNAASGRGAVVAGGGGLEYDIVKPGNPPTPRGNTASGDWSAVSGGGDNVASGRYSVVGGGSMNTASGEDSFVAGGCNNEAAGVHSFAGGLEARATHNGSFVWSDNSSRVAFPSSAANEFAVRATGGVRMVSALDFDGAPIAGVRLPPGSGPWNTLSDKNSKTNLAKVDGREILARLAAIPIATWNYKTQDSSVRHIGPMAQDFAAAFAVGEDEKSISNVDADGVALAAIQGLHEIVKEKDAEVAELRARLATLERNLSQTNK